MRRYELQRLSEVLLEKQAAHGYAVNSPELAGL